MRRVLGGAPYSRETRSAEPDHRAGREWLTANRTLTLELQRLRPTESTLAGHVGRPTPATETETTRSTTPKGAQHRWLGNAH